MFESKQGQIPGYTGHQRGVEEIDQGCYVSEPRKHIPGMYFVTILKSFLGYGGYVPGIKSENVYGQTYGKTTLQSTSGGIPRGYDQPPQTKFNTSFKSQYVNHADFSHETVA